VGVFFIPIGGYDNIISISFSCPVNDASIMIGSVQWKIPTDKGSKGGEIIRLGKDRPFPILGLRAQQMTIRYFPNRRDDEVSLTIQFGTYTQKEADALQSGIPPLTQVNHPGEIPIVLSLIGGDYYPISVDQILVPAVDHMFSDSIIDEETRDFLFDQILARRNERSKATTRTTRK
jgi:hypothetical protein